ncbi:MAG: DUF1295 domain-containing protein [Microthrixaceae bacterium]|nr:DUF1295 domain-containing protein [Microthrixaceae bacterium]
MEGPAKAVLGSVAAVAVAVVVAFAGASGGVSRGGVPVVLWATAVAFAVNWVVFVPSWLTRTERYYDLTGTLSYLTVMLLAIVMVGRYDPRSLLLTGLVAVWTTRLGTFLFRRIRKAGSDSRFERILTDPAQLFMTWTLQGLWVSLTLAAALAAVTSTTEEPLAWWWLAGAALWTVGFVLESVADLQKSRFRADDSNRGDFITSGVWAWSRHPNYLGEIMLWTGVALIALPALQGWQFVTLISPLFVFVLLRYISGIPLLERSARRRWGDDPRWLAYQRNTPMLLPRRPRPDPVADGGATG